MRPRNFGLLAVASRPSRSSADAVWRFSMLTESTADRPGGILLQARRENASPRTHTPRTHACAAHRMCEERAKEGRLMRIVFGLSVAGALGLGCGETLPHPPYIQQPPDALVVI